MHTLGESGFLRGSDWVLRTFIRPPTETGIDIISGPMYPVNMFRYSFPECICRRESEFPIA